MKRKLLAGMLCSAAAATPAVGQYTLTTLVTFNVTNGAGPQCSLVADASGNLYGTTDGGGTGTPSNGTVFEIAAGTRALTTLVNFNGSNGERPEAGLTADANGNFYGTTAGGGPGAPYPAGTVFEVAGNTHALITKAAFSITGPGPSGPNGPYASPIIDAAGDLFGTTALGGTFQGNGGDGTVYEIPAGSNTATVLHSFSNGLDGLEPNGRLLEDGSGNLYGISPGNGEGNRLIAGAVFEISPNVNPMLSPTFTTLATLNIDGSQGTNPRAGLVMDSHGNLYGTTEEGGASGMGSGGSNTGTVFEITAGTHTVITLHSFNGSDGAQPTGDLLFDAQGNLYGTTTRSNSAGSGPGTVFEIAAGTHALTTLHYFGDEAEGDDPSAGLIMDANGNLYGTTSGEQGGNGTVFELSPGIAWTSTHSDNWNIAGDWSSGTVPNIPADRVNFGNSIGSVSRSVTLTANQTVGAITFLNSLGASYTINAINGSSLIIDDTGDAVVNPLIDVQTGNDTISVPLVLVNGVNFTFQGGSSLTITSGITGAGPVNVSGGGTLAIGTTGLLNPASALLINGGAVVVLAAGAQPSVPGVQTVAGLSFDGTPGSKLDITNNEMIVTGTTPADIRADIVAGRIVSTSVIDSWHGIGFIADGSGTEIRYTILGDTNLDGKINFSDLLSLASNYGASSATWAMGDLNYDGTVNFTDLLDLAGNYGESLLPGEESQVSASFAADWNLAVSEVSASVPEPGMMGVVVLGWAGGMFGRRQRN